MRETPFKINFSLQNRGSDLLFDAIDELVRVFLRKYHFDSFLPIPFHYVQSDDMSVNLDKLIEVSEENYVGRAKALHSEIVYEALLLQVLNIYQKTHSF